MWMRHPVASDPADSARTIVAGLISGGNWLQDVRSLRIPNTRVLILGSGAVISPCREIAVSHRHYVQTFHCKHALDICNNCKGTYNLIQIAAQCYWSRFGEHCLLLSALNSPQPVHIFSNCSWKRSSGSLYTQHACGVLSSMLSEGLPSVAQDSPELDIVFLPYGQYSPFSQTTLTLERQAC